jgi:hypothetical protein
MRRVVALVTLLLALAAPPAAAQAPSYGCCGFTDWLTYGASDPLRWHPSADLMGGAAMIAIARGPWFAKDFRDKRWKRLVIVGLGAAAWQYQNKKEIAGYRWDYVAMDWTWTVTSAFLVDVVIEAAR